MFFFESYEAIREHVTIVGFLGRMGFNPVQQGYKREIFYNSMIRDGDRTPSFSVNPEKERWYDHGMGVGGDIIGLAKRIFGTDSKQELIAKMNDLYHNVSIATIPKRQTAKEQPTSAKYKIDKINDIGSTPALTQYIRKRGVLTEAQNCGFIKEVYYSHIRHDRIARFYSIGWKNNAGGWELRNSFSKICLFHKDFTFLGCNMQRLTIFEGVFDYLTAIKEDVLHFPTDILILNSLSMWKRAFRLLEESGYTTIDLFLDNDLKGKEMTAKIMAAFPQAIDRSGLYSPYKDYNEKIEKAILYSNSNPKD